MLAPTHGVFGLFLTLILLAMFGVQESLNWVILVAAIFGSLAPDIDLPSSIMGRLFWFISKPLERRFGHRTVTHSLLGWGIASLLFGLVAASAFYIFDALHYTPIIADFFKTSQTQTAHHLLRVIVAFSIGYASHILLDMFNPRGVQLLWPDDARDVIPGNIKFRPNAGSKAESAIFVAFSLLLILALPLSNYGVMTSLRWLLATPESAIAEFKTSHFRTYVEFEGILQTTKEKISGTAEILDSQNKRLIILYPAHHTLSKVHPPNPPSKKGGPPPTILTLSDELTADILTTKVRAIKTQQKIQTKKITFEDQTPDYLFTLFTDTDLVSGTITLPDDLKLTIPPTTKGTFTPITQSGTTLTLQFATKDQLGALKLKNSTLHHRQTQERHLNDLNQKRTLLQNKIHRLENTSQETPTDLTPLGQQILGAPTKPHKNNQETLDRLNAQFETLNDQIADLENSIENAKLLFSGEVWLRSI